MKITGSVDVLSAQEIQAITDNALRVLDEIGVLVENAELLARLAEFGAHVDRATQRARFPRRIVEDFLASASPDYDEAEGLETSCLFPYGDRALYARGVECTAGTYPQMYMDLEGDIQPHTVHTASEMTRLADALPHFDRLGVMGVPCDVPPALQPLSMRLVAWKNADHKLSGCGEVQNAALVPYIVAMGERMADLKQAPLRRYAFAEVEMISPLRFKKGECEIFVEFWKRDLLCGVGFMHSAGGSAPATLAGTLSLALAESLFVCILYRLCYGFRKLWFQINASVLDMKHAMFPFGRPERGLMALAMGQLARHFGAGLWASAVYADAKAPSCETGMQAAFNAVPAILAGSLGLECFGILSGGEMGSVLQLVIDNEFCGALKRFARGFEVNAETLAYETIRECAASGFFTGSAHTVQHFRSEHWEPQIFSRETLAHWEDAGRTLDVDLARDKAAEILDSVHPHDLSDAVEKELLRIIDSARRDLL